jgi:hypothetical protein
MPELPNYQADVRSDIHGRRKRVVHCRNTNRYKVNCLHWYQIQDVNFSGGEKRRGVTRVLVSWSTAFTTLFDSRD